MRSPAPIRALLVDDDPDQLELEVMEMRGCRGFEVATARSAAQALDLLGDSRFDCIVSDYRMPNMTGLELCRRLRKEGNTIPFILFTAHWDEELADSAFKAGSSVCLGKDKGETALSDLAETVSKAVKN